MKPWMITIVLAVFSCGPAEDRDLPASYRDLAVPQNVLKSPEARARGQALFAMHCSICHGVRGDGRGERVTALSTKPRNFADPDWQQRTSDRHILHSIREGVSGTAMPAWKTLTMDESWDLVAFIRSFGQPAGRRD